MSSNSRQHLDSVVPRRALITGANKGLGFEFARQLSESGWKVHAACRTPSNARALMALSDQAPDCVRLESLDVTDQKSVDGLGRKLEGQPIDLLLNNAGIIDARPATFSEQSRRSLQALGAIDYRGWLKVFDTNVLGALRVTEALLENVLASDRKVIAMTSSVMGSITANNIDAFPPGGGIYIYRSSKAALNMVVRSLAADLRDKGVNVLALNPGWVKTDMGGPDARLDAVTSVRGMLRVIETVTREDTGSFISHDGTRLPW